MKCDKAQQQILLAQSGELSGFSRHGLARHLKTCPSCRAYQQELHQITQQVRETPVTEDSLPTWQLNPILNAARRQIDRDRRQQRQASNEPFLIMWRPALIYASLGILLVVALLLIMRPVMQPTQQVAALPTPLTLQESALPETSTATEWEDRLDNELEQLDQQIAQLPVDLESVAATKNDDDLDAIARELIQLEAWTI